jgi:hypothetical protein
MNKKKKTRNKYSRKINNKNNKSKKNLNKSKRSNIKYNDSKKLTGGASNEQAPVPAAGERERGGKPAKAAFHANAKRAEEKERAVKAIMEELAKENKKSAVKNNELVNTNNREVTEEKKKEIKKIIGIPPGQWNSLQSFSFDVVDAAHKMGDTRFGPGIRKEDAENNIKFLTDQMKALEREEDEIFKSDQKQTNEFNNLRAEDKNAVGNGKDELQLFLKMKAETKKKLKDIYKRKKELYETAISLPGISIDHYSHIIPNGTTQKELNAELNTNNSQLMNSQFIGFGAIALLAGAAVTTALLLEG